MAERLAVPSLDSRRRKTRKVDGRNETLAEDGGLKSRQAEFNARRRSALPARLAQSDGGDAVRGGAGPQRLEGWAVDRREDEWGNG
jgi:hypothetical protein